MRRRLLPIVLAPALVLAAALPASAAPLPLPPGFPDTPDNHFYYNVWFGPDKPDWTPQGTVVADSGFRARPNGLPYSNYGDNAFPLFFGTPSTLIPTLTSPWMRDLYGDGVCAGKPKADGTCALTPAAEYFAAYLAQYADSIGHCVGIAVTTQGVYSGALDPSAIAAETLAFQSQLTPDTQSIILRNWSTQFTAPQTQLTPAGVVEQLIEELQSQQVPSSLLIHWPGGGHGITPYAVYDRGNGLYDIAIYDNNYPGRARAIHVDTIADTWEYEVETNPSAPPLIARGDATTLSMQLMSVEDALATQECPVCLGGRESSLMVTEPVPTAAASGLNLTLLNLDDSPLSQDEVNFLPVLDSGNPDLTALQPAEVDAPDGYQAVVSTGPGGPFPFTMTDLTNGGARAYRLPALAADDTVTAIFAGNGVFAVETTIPARPALRESFKAGKRHFIVEASKGTLVQSTTARWIGRDVANGRVALGDIAREGGKITIGAEIQVGSTSQGYVATGVKYPTGGELVLVYSGWKNVGQAPQLWLDRDADGKLDKRIPMRKVS